MNVPKIEKDEIMSILYIAGMLLFVFFIYKIFAGLGIIKTRKRKDEEAAKDTAAGELRTSEFFDPIILQTTTSSNSLGTNAKVYATDLRKAIRGIGTDEELIFVTFGKLKTKYNISEVAFMYRELYKKDLLTDILNDLTAKEQVTLWNIINKLPEK